MLDTKLFYKVIIYFYKMLAAAKYIGAGVACSGLIGAGSEICGVWHGFMPIVVEAVSANDFLVWIDSASSDSDTYSSSLFLIIKNKIIKFKKDKNNKILEFKTWFLQKWGKTPVYLGFIKANSIPTLPAKVEQFYSHIFVRIFRVIGGLSCLLVLTKIYLLLPGFLPLILAILASIHITQVIILLIINFFYGLYIIAFKKEKF